MWTLQFVLLKRFEWNDSSGAMTDYVQANSLVNRAVEEGNICDLSIVVLDELHMIHDDYRGYLMELMTTKLLCMQQSIQIVGMSATLSVGFYPETRRKHC